MKVYHVVKKTPGTRERERDRERERERERFIRVWKNVGN